MRPKSSAKRTAFLVARSRARATLHKDDTHKPPRAPSHPTELELQSVYQWKRRKWNSWAPPALTGSAIGVVGDTVFMFGGFGTADGFSNALSSVSLTAPGGKWRVRHAGGRGPTPRAGHTITAVGCELWVFGGECHKAVRKQVVRGNRLLCESREILDELVVLNTETMRWRHPVSTIRTLRKAPNRRSHTTTFLPHVGENGSLLVIGGMGPTSGLGAQEYKNDVHVFDMATQAWQQVGCGGAPPCIRANHTATLVEATGKVYVLGGRSTDPAPPTSAVPEASVSRTILQSVMSASVSDLGPEFGGVYSTSDEDDGWASSSTLLFAPPTVHCLDTVTWTWSVLDATGDGPGQISGHSAHADAGGLPLVYVFGGQHACGDLSRHTYVLDVSAGVWTALTTRGPPMAPRFNHASTLWHDMVVVYGGCTLREYQAPGVMHLLKLPPVPPLPTPVPESPGQRVVRVTANRGFEMVESMVSLYSRPATGSSTVLTEHRRPASRQDPFFPFPSADAKAAAVAIAGNENAAMEFAPVIVAMSAPAHPSLPGTVNDGPAVDTGPVTERVAHVAATGLSPMTLERSPKGRRRKPTWLGFTPVRVQSSGRGVEEEKKCEDTRMPVVKSSEESLWWQQGNSRPMFQVAEDVIVSRRRSLGSRGSSRNRRRTLSTADTTAPRRRPGTCSSRASLCSRHSIGSSKARPRSVAGRRTDAPRSMRGSLSDTLHGVPGTPLRPATQHSAFSRVETPDRWQPSPSASVAAQDLATTLSNSGVAHHVFADSGVLFADVSRAAETMLREEGV